MEQNQAIKIIERQKDNIQEIKNQSDSESSPNFIKWHRDTKTAIGKIFGKNSQHLHDFSNISYSMMCFTTMTSDYEFRQAFISGLNEAEAILDSMIDEISEYGIDNPSFSLKSTPISTIERLCTRFHNVVRQLQSRYNDRDTIDIDDEYDVQDVLHALLRIHFDDIRPEEYTPSYAGSSTRVDFLLKNEKVVIEVKKTRKNLKAKELGEQLILDIAHYRVHPDCNQLICFVYDPEGKIANPRGVEADLEKTDGKMKVRVIIAPR